MIKLPLPADGNGNLLLARTVFETCISRVRNPDLKARLSAVTESIEAAGNLYDEKCRAGNLHQLLPQDAINGNVSNEEMVGVYTRRMAQTGQPGRPFYDLIRAAAPGAICPLCAIGVVTTLDHQLPKAKFSQYVVTPNNLVPACDWCQGEKDSGYPSGAQDQWIHPYFDDLQADVWLGARVVEAPNPGFVFEVVAPNTWDSTRIRKAEKHLSTFGLYRLYSVNAGADIYSQQGYLQDLFAAGGANAVRDFMAEAAARIRYPMNSWRKATYEAASASEWFCDMGFNEIGGN